MPSRTKPKTNKKVFTIIDAETKRQICHIDKESKRGRYFLRPGSAQRQWVSSIVLSGFQKLPAGLTRNGNGFTKPGYLILQFLSEKFGPFKLTIDAVRETEISRTTDGRQVTLNHAKLRDLLSGLRTIRNIQFNEQKNLVRSFLAESFPRHFKGVAAEELLYRADTLAHVLQKKQVVGNLSLKDVERLGEFYPEFLKHFGARVKEPEKLIAISKNKKAAEVVYIEKIVKEYERRLKAETQSEHKWQEFLGKYILVFNTNYATALEKESVALHGKYPDFMLVDAYNYLDIYEIKKPNTTLLRKDESRENYYWDVELAKAISQVEKYIAYAEKHADNLRVEIKKRKSVDVRVLKPRGFIIAGTRKQLENEEMEDDFRLLNNSLKNIEVVLYDDLLNGLKNFLKRLKKGD